MRRLSISYDWQEAIIRAAITLKLSNFEETGGIIAAHTTSIPEAPGSGRNWDYRYCWLRDAYFVVKALNRIGATRTMEEYISFMISIASKLTRNCAHSTAWCQQTTIEERTAPELKGYRGHGPVRIGNAAVIRRSMIPMAASFWPPCRCFSTGACRDPAMKVCSICWKSSASARRRRRWSRMPASGNIADASASTPIRRRCAGPAASDSRQSPTRIGLDDRAKYWNAIAEPIHADVAGARLERKARGLHRGIRMDDMDASVLLLPDLGVMEVDDPRFASTVAAMERELVREKHVMRYAGADDFGLPVTAFLVCRFWLIDALWRWAAARRRATCSSTRCNHRNRYGLLAEDIDPQTGELWGNFPQTYSMAGLILSAMRLSRSWEDRYWRG